MKDDEIASRKSLSTLIQNPDVLPGAGYIGFGLEFMQPVAAGGTKLETSSSPSELAMAWSNTSWNS